MLSNIAPFTSWCSVKASLVRSQASPQSMTTREVKKQAFGALAWGCVQSSNDRFLAFWKVQEESTVVQLRQAFDCCGNRVFPFCAGRLWWFFGDERGRRVSSRIQTLGRAAKASYLSHRASENRWSCIEQHAVVFLAMWDKNDKKTYVL